MYGYKHRVCFRHHKERCAGGVFISPHTTVTSTSQILIMNPNPAVWGFGEFCSSPLAAKTHHQILSATPEYTQVFGVVGPWVPTGCCSVFSSISLSTLNACSAASQVSGVAEGRPANVISPEPDAWFETNDSPDPLPWIQLELPSNVTITSLTRFTYAHGHRRAGYFRMRCFKVQVAQQVSGPWSDVHTR